MRAFLADIIRAEGRAVLLMVLDARGSTPREAGAAMIVGRASTSGTIGGGRAEHEALAAARAMLASGDSRRLLDFPLGPDLDQCCGGFLRVAAALIGPDRLPDLTSNDAFALWPEGPLWPAPAPLRPVYIYGAGHVGQALALALAPLPFATRLIDALTEILPEARAAEAPAGAFHIVVTHSHALDLEIVSALLEKGRFGWLGLIGSATKRALFERRLRERGLDPAPLVCPIGGGDVKDKRPAVIAALTAAELIREDAARQKEGPVVTGDHNTRSTRR